MMKHSFYLPIFLCCLAATICPAFAQNKMYEYTGKSYAAQPLAIFSEGYHAVLTASGKLGRRYSAVKDGAIYIVNLDGTLGNKVGTVDGSQIKNIVGQVIGNMQPDGVVFEVDRKDPVGKVDPPSVAAAAGMFFFNIFER